MKESDQSMLALLSNRNFSIFVMSNALWWQTLFMEMIAMGWLVFDLTDSAWLVALVGFFRSAPFLISGFIGGPITDHFGRRKVIQTTQSAALVIYALIAFLIWSNQVALWHLCLLSFLLGMGWSLDFPARRSLIPDLVSKERTVDGLLLESFAQGISRIIGPYIAGLLIDRTGASGCFFFMTFLSLVALGGVLAISGLPIERQQNDAHEPAWKMIREGFRYVGFNRTILAVVLVTVVMNLLIFPYTALLPVFARDILERGATGLGTLGSGTGIGAFVGLYLINRFRHTTNAGRMFMIGSMGQCIGLALFSISTIFPLSWFFLFCAGIGQACFAVLQSSIVLVASSDDMRSRSMATIVLAIGADPLGKIQTGLLAENFGAPFTLGLQASLAALLVGAVALLLPESHRQPAQPDVAAQSSTTTRS